MTETNRLIETTRERGLISVLITTKNNTRPYYAANSSSSPDFYFGQNGVAVLCVRMGSSLEKGVNTLKKS